MLGIDCAIVLRHIVLRDNGFGSSMTIWVAPDTSDQTPQVSPQPSSAREVVMPYRWSSGCLGE